jgi:hypothetical protein
MLLALSGCGEDVIADPNAWTLEHFIAVEGALEETRADLDGDGIPDLMLGVRGRGIGSTRPHAIFRDTGNGYVYLGDLTFDPNHYRVLEPDRGRISLRVFQHTAEREGVISTLVHGPSGFTPDGPPQLVTLDDRGNAPELNDL